MAHTIVFVGKKVELMESISYIMTHLHDAIRQFINGPYFHGLAVRPYNYLYGVLNDVISGYILSMNETLESLPHLYYNIHFYDTGIEHVTITYQCEVIVGGLPVRIMVARCSLCEIRVTNKGIIITMCNGMPCFSNTKYAGVTNIIISEMMATTTIYWPVISRVMEHWNAVSALTLEDCLV